MGLGRYEITFGFYSKLSDISQRNGETNVSGSTETLVDEAHSCALLSGTSSLALLSLSSYCYLVVKLCTPIILICGGEIVISALGDEIWLAGYRTATWKETFDT